jgi:LysM repeat protein
MVFESLKKASIISLDKDGKKKDELKVLFNPEQYSIEKSNQFASQPLAGQEQPIVQFVRGEAETLSVELFFDTYTYYNSEDVRNYTDRISTLMEKTKETHAPPICIFEWGGDVISGVIERASKRFTMFKDDGTPVRAIVSVTFRQATKVVVAKEESPDRTKRRLVKQGDTLWMFAAKEYGDPSKWKVIANANGLSNVRVLKPGTEIKIPPL